MLVKLKDRSDIVLKYKYIRHIRNPYNKLKGCTLVLFSDNDTIGIHKALFKHFGKIVNVRKTGLNKDSEYFNLNGFNLHKDAIDWNVKIIGGRK